MVNFTSGTGTITLAGLSGAGTTTFSSNGSIPTISAGTVTVAGVATIGTANGGAANLNGTTASITTLNDTIVTLSGSTTLTVTNGTQTTGTLTGGNLIKVGSASDKLTLNGSSPYTGGITLDGGTLSTSYVPNANIIFAGGTWEFTGATGTKDLNTGSPQNINISVTTGTLNVTQNAGNYNTLVKSGAGIINVVNSGAQDGGNLEVDQGTVVLAGSTSVGAGYANVASVTDVKTGATIKLANGNGGQVWYGFGFAMSGGTFDVNGQNPGFGRNTSVPAISGSGFITNNVSGTGTAVFGIISNKTFTGNIVDGTGTVGIALVYGGSTWTLSGANTYSGATTVNSGTLSAGSTTAFSPNSNFVVNGVLDLAGFNNTIPSLTGGGTVKSTGGTATLTINNTTADAFTGILQDGTSGTLSLKKQGVGTLTLSGVNSYSGLTMLEAGRLQINGHNTSSFGGATIDGGTLIANNGGTGSATANGPVTLNGGTLRGGAAGGTIAGLVSAGGVAAHTIAAGPGVNPVGGLFSYGSLTLTGGLVTSGDPVTGTTLAFNLGAPVNAGSYTGDTLAVNNALSTFASGTKISVDYSNSPTQTFTSGQFFRLIQNTTTTQSFPNSVLSNFVLSSSPALPPSQQFILSTTEEAGWIDLVVALTATTWTGLSGNSWADPGNWSSAIPAAGQAATFCDPILGTGATADLGNTNGTMGQLIFNSNHGSVTIQSSGTGKLVLNNGSLTSTVNVTGSGHSITAPVSLASAATQITVNPGSDLTISGAIDGSSSLSKEGPGALTIGGTNTSFTGSTTINKGTLRTTNLYALGNPSNASLSPFTAASVTVGTNGTLHVDVPGIHLASLTVNGTVTTTSLAVGGAGSTGNIELGTVDASGNTVVPGTLNLGGPDIYSPAGLIDLQDRMLIVHYTQDTVAPSILDGPATAIKAALVSGRNVAPGGVFDGPWTGTAGITSSRAASDFSAANAATGSPNTEFYALGYGDTGKKTLGDGTITNKMLINDAGPSFYDPNADGGRGAGVGSTVFVRYTRVGDATMDGIVGNNDVTVLGLNFDPTYNPATNPEGPKQWYDGDFNYNGIVDNNDVTILGLQFDPTNTTGVLYSSLVSQYGSSFAAAFMQGVDMGRPSASVVPEPGALTLLGVGALALIRRRRQA